MNERAELGRPDNRPSQRGAEFATRVTQLIAAPEFMRHINGRGFSPWVGLLHAPGRRRTGDAHPTGARARIGRGSDLTSDHRMAVLVDVPDSTRPGVGYAPLVGVVNLVCAGCGGRLTLSELDLLESVVTSLLRDTRDGAHYSARVQ